MTTEASDKTLSYSYLFADGRLETIDLHFTKDMRLLGGAEEPWTALSVFRCEHCPLGVDGHCPFAMALAPVVERFSQDISYTPVTVTVNLSTKVISAYRDLQHGLSPLVGLIGATSGCPHLEFFRPMARTHLPFSDEQDTLFRLIASHLLGRYFAHGRGTSILAMDFPELIAWCLAAAKVNRFMASRIRSATTGDAIVNALITLDSGIQAIQYVIEDELEDLAWLYKSAAK